VVKLQRWLHEEDVSRKMGCLEQKVSQQLAGEIKSACQGPPIEGEKKMELEHKCLGLVGEKIDL
jgi:hypothetical protein